MLMGLDRIYHAHQFIFSFSFTFLFIPCGRLSWLTNRFYCTLNTHYRIVSYEIGQHLLAKVYYRDHTNTVQEQTIMALAVTNTYKTYGCRIRWANAVMYSKTT